jgi:hypothetical protein
MIIEYCDNGLPILLDESSKEIIYKENRVPFSVIKEAFESGYDRIQLTKDVMFKRTFDMVEFGCLIMSKDKTKILIRKVCNKLK